jgi:hypothetical protein
MGSTWRAARLIGGPRDGDRYPAPAPATICCDYPAVTNTSWSTEAPPPIERRTTFYHQRHVMLADKHPCVRDLRVTREWTVWLWDGADESDPAVLIAATEGPADREITLCESGGPTSDVQEALSRPTRRERRG